MLVLSVTDRTHVLAHWRGGLWEDDSMTEVSQTDYSLDTRGKKMRTLVLRL